MATEASIRRVFCQLHEVAVAVGDDVTTAQVVAVVKMEVSGTGGVGRRPCPEGEGLSQPVEGTDEESPFTFPLTPSTSLRTGLTLSPSRGRGEP